MTSYTIRIDPVKERVLFHGVEWGYGLGNELLLWSYYQDSPIIVVKKPGASSWVGRGESGYSPAEFMVLEIIGTGILDGWCQAKCLVSFPMRKPGIYL